MFSKNNKKTEIEDQSRSKTDQNTYMVFEPSCNLFLFFLIQWLTSNLTQKKFLKLALVLLILNFSTIKGVVADNVSQNTKTIIFLMG